MCPQAQEREKRREMGKKKMKETEEKSRKNRGNN
jgi:hypothetical protein